MIVVDELGDLIGVQVAKVGRLRGWRASLNGRVIAFLHSGNYLFG